MRLSVHVTPRARRAGVVRVAPNEFRVAVTAPPHEGRANKAVIDLLAAYFQVPRSRVRIIRGQAGRHKVVDVGSGMQRGSP